LLLLNFRCDAPFRFLLAVLQIASQFTQSEAKGRTFYVRQFYSPIVILGISRLTKKDDKRTEPRTERRKGR